MKNITVSSIPECKLYKNNVRLEQTLQGEKKTLKTLEIIQNHVLAKKAHSFRTDEGVTVLIMCLIINFSSSVLNLISSDFGPRGT